jgi:hypothetical protein
MRRANENKPDSRGLSSLPFQKKKKINRLTAVGLIQDTSLSEDRRRTVCFSQALLAPTGYGTRNSLSLFTTKKHIIFYETFLTFWTYWNFKNVSNVSFLTFLEP